MLSCERLAVLLRVARAFFVTRHHQVRSRVMSALGIGPGADLKDNGVAPGAVDEAMPIGDAGLPRRRVSRFQHGLAVVLAEHDLVLVLVPVTLRRRGARLEPAEIDAELRQPGAAREPLAKAAFDRLVKRWRIARIGVERDLVDVDLRHRDHTLSIMVAVPMPAPMQSVTSAVPRSRRSSSSSAVPRIMAPVAPSGCPMAMAPPLTLTLLSSRSKAWRKRSTTAAKASFTSIRSMSLSFIRARLSTFSVTSMGPVSIIAGSEPILAKALILARGFSPAPLPAFLLPINTAAAPSTMPEELPA